jgi:TolB-like protein/tetratricopeptide (TPR) repeat protein
MGDTPTSRDVFISYASQDQAVADAACQALELAGIPCWIAPRDVSPGEFYADAIVRALNESRILVLMLTTNAIASPHVLREVERTSAKRHAIVALRFASVSLTPALEYFLSASHWLDASESSIDSALPKLVEAVKRLMAPPVAPIPSKGATGLFQAPLGSVHDHRRSRLTIAAIAVIGAALAYLVVDKVFLSIHVANPAETAVPASSAPAPKVAVPAENSIAVLPFADMSEKKDQEYFSDGLSEELIDSLARIPDLAVSARTSSFYFKGKQTTIAEIARALGVAHVLEGSVRKSGNRLRVTVQLIRADNGYHLWSDTYDRKLDDIFKIQDEISALVIKALKLAMRSGTPVAAAETTNTQANDLYLRAKFIFWKLTGDSSARTTELLKQALLLDPNFARAWALLARARSSFAWQSEESSVADAADAIREARDAAERAVAFAPNIADGHLALGRIYLGEDRDIAKAQVEFERAIELEPRNADAVLQLGNIATSLGRFDEGVRASEKALTLDPLNANIMVVLEEDCLAMGDGATAERVARRVGELFPDNKYWRSDRAFALTLLGRVQEAYAQAEAAAGGEYEHLGNQAYFFPALGRKAEADAALIRLEAAGANNVSPLLIAAVYGHRGNKDRAIEWLDRQYKLDPRALTGIDRDIDFMGMRNDDRFKELRRKLKLPELSPASPPPR